jgi:transketolase
MPNAGNSGHPGAPMGMAPIAHVLWSRHLRFDANEPFWFSRDRFVLSNGHACALLYGMLHLSGYKQFPIEEIKRFRHLGSHTPGHPENYMHGVGRMGGIEVTTGPLGQGISNAVGIALAESHLAAVHNAPEFPVVDSYTYVTVGDGCLQEGVASEAASLAGHLALHKLIVFYDDNKITIDGSTDISFTEDVTKRFESYGWQVLQVDDGDHDLDGIDAAIRLAKANKTQPKLIRVKTVIGFDAKKQGSHGVHGSPLGWDETDRLREKYGLPKERHSVPDDVAALYKAVATRNTALTAAWHALVARYNNAAFNARVAGSLPDGWQAAAADLQVERQGRGDAQARRPRARQDHRQRHGADRRLGRSHRLESDALRQRRRLPEDVAPRPLPALRRARARHGGDLQRHGRVPPGRAHSALRHVPQLHPVLPAVGASQRALALWRDLRHDARLDRPRRGWPDAPADQRRRHCPLDAQRALRAPRRRQRVGGRVGDRRARALAPHRDGDEPPDDAAPRGLVDREDVPRRLRLVPGADKPSVVLVGTGTEVQLCVDAAKQIAGARVVSMPCCELFDEQSLEYRRSVIPTGVPVVSVEALSTYGWSRYSHAQVGMTTFGASGPAPDVYKHFGITVDGVVTKAKTAIAYYQIASKCRTSSTDFERD